MARSGVTMHFFVARDVRSVVVVARASPSSFAPAPHREASVTVMRPRLGLRTRRGRLVVVRPRLRAPRASTARRVRRPPPPRIRDPVVISRGRRRARGAQTRGHEFPQRRPRAPPPGRARHPPRVASAARSGSDYDGPLHAVHRLDKVTSGALLFAKTPDAAAALAAEFRARRVHKYYVALSARRPSKKMGTVAGDMARTRRGAWKLLRRKNASDSEPGDPRSSGTQTRTNTPTRRRHSFRRARRRGRGRTTPSHVRHATAHR